MSAIEITMLLIGVAFLVGSFMVSDKLSGKDMEKIAELSEQEINVIMEKQLNQADMRISSRVEDLVEDVSSSTKRSMEKLSNEKIMAINEFSDTVLTSINKSHEEIMFLYSMLNDKHTELTELAGQLSDFSSDMRRTENELLERLAASAEQVRARVSEQSEVIETQKLLEESVESAAEVVPALNNTAPNEESRHEENHNEHILHLHQDGRTAVEIAKELGLGLGEVKLVIDLYRGAAL